MNNVYNVHLNEWVGIVESSGEKEAIILAQAEAIKEGRNYRLIGISNITPMETK
ncbi:hypothetical protein D3C74_302730 [compost metagenome]